MNYNNRQQFSNARQQYAPVNTPVSAPAECCCNNSGTTRGNRRIADPLEGLPLASSYTPWQRFVNIYPESEALCYGTIFADLYLPFTGRRP